MIRRSLALLLALLAPFSTAQAAALAEVQGSLRLSGGAPAAGVELRLLDLSSGRVTTTRSDEAGQFRSPVAPGVYAVEAGRGYEIARGPRVVSAMVGQPVSAMLVITQATTPATQLSLQHDPKGCMAADQHPQIDAAINPSASVKFARVYFKGARDAAFHYVEMAPEIGRYLACLPEPQKEAGPVDYYVEATGTDGGTTRSPGVDSLVVDSAADCPPGRHLAVVCPGNQPVNVYGAGFPSAFTGIAGGASAISTTTTGALVVIGASIIGVGIQIGGTGPASPSR